LRNVLANRLRLEAALKHYPAILDEPVPAPIVVAGLQRTGTTFLHRLLAAVPGLRTLASWEALQPIPFGARPVAGRAGAHAEQSHREQARADQPLAPLARAGQPQADPARLRAARQAETALRYLSPDFFAIHPVEHDAPEEDVLLLDNALLSTVPEATMHVPGYAQWLEEQDHEPAYRHLRVMLQALQFFGGRGRWVLKSPHHLEHLAVIRKVFPGALVVQTHRDPALTYPSFFSMVWHGRRVFSDQVPPEEVAAHWRRKNGLMLHRAMAFRSAVADQDCMDIAYAELVRHPAQIVRQILAGVGMAFDPATAAAVQAAVSAQAPQRYGKHAYDLADFGLTAEALAPDWQAYRHRFADYLDAPAHHG
jgi:hypothetical protein